MFQTSQEMDQEGNLTWRFGKHQVRRLGEGVFTTQSRILVQFLHKAKDIYCKNNKSSGCPNVCKHL